MTLLCDRTGLHLPDKVIEIGSTEWLEWLNANKSFRFECPHNTEIQEGIVRIATATFTGIKQGKYWQAHKKVKGQLRRDYLGKPEELTYETLRETAYRICSEQYWESHRAEKKSRAESHKADSETVKEVVLETTAKIEGLSQKVAVLTAKLEQLEAEGAADKKAITNLEQRLNQSALPLDALQLIRKAVTAPNGTGKGASGYQNKSFTQGVKDIRQALALLEQHQSAIALESDEVSRKN